MSENLNNEEIKAYINGLEIQIANYISKNSDLLLKVERLRKAGIALGMCLPDTDKANAAYRAFEYAAKEGKPSV